MGLVVILLLAYCFNESVFETQYGLTLFTFFPLFLYFGTENISVSKTGIQEQKSYLKADTKSFVT